MEVLGDYEGDGYVQVRGLIAPEVARAFMGSIKQDIGPAPIEMSPDAKHPMQLRRPTFGVYGHNYKPMLLFLWGLTPVISQITGRELLPTYDYFRIYREGDICRVHSDRASCEHSVSLTLDYSDGAVWDLQVGHGRLSSTRPVEDDFGGQEYSSVPMQVGDAVVYQGVHYAHGRIHPNPNAWSAHLFLHFVDRNGPFAAEAFDRKIALQPVNFSFL